MHRHFVLIKRERKWDCMQLSKRGSDAALRSCVSHMYLAACVAALSSMTPRHIKSGRTRKRRERVTDSKVARRYCSCECHLAGLPVLMLWDKMTHTCTCSGSGRYARAGLEIGTRLFHTVATDPFAKTRHSRCIHVNLHIDPFAMYRAPSCSPLAAWRRPIGRSRRPPLPWASPCRAAPRRRRGEAAPT